MNTLVRTRPLPPTGLVAFLATVAMLFTAFTASYLVRRTGTDWRPVPLPGVLWVNLAVLAASSLTIEAARRSDRPRPMLAVTLALGTLFLAGQILAWRQLSSAGIHLPGSPHGSFLYMLSGVHALHVLGGLAALAAALQSARRPRGCAAYWHLMGLVWASMLLLLAAV